MMKVNRGKQKQELTAVLTLSLDLVSVLTSIWRTWGVAKQ